MIISITSSSNLQSLSSPSALRNHDDYNHLVPFLLLPSKCLLEELSRHLVGEVVLQAERKIIEDQIIYRRSIMIMIITETMKGNLCELMTVGWNSWAASTCSLNTCNNNLEDHHGVDGQPPSCGFQLASSCPTPRAARA